ncbi:hypothetical protein SSX86_025729 [Deinandra increscens subsp. villosa]|uniref:SAM domain-containing protein n=1 Tax=Deinandra increscens subsp. villosa TaxID=3103831 RepID=A0AAP0CIG8_9ASTR
MHQSIDWFSWLSKTGLETSLICEYGMTFSRNELEEDDITYFNHEFLQSMGISIGKHRLEILKLARKQQKGPNGSHPVSKLVIAIKKTKRTLASYIRTWVHRDDSTLVLVRKSHGSRWKGNMLRRNKRFVTFKQPSPILLLTNGYHKSNDVRLNNFSSPSVFRCDQEKSKSQGYGDDHSSLDEDWSDGGVREIKWDAMFQNLKPT